MLLQTYWVRKLRLLCFVFFLFVWVIIVRVLTPPREPGWTQLSDDRENLSVGSIDIGNSCREEEGALHTFPCPCPLTRLVSTYLLTPPNVALWTMRPSSLMQGTWGVTLPRTMPFSVRHCTEDYTTPKDTRKQEVGRQGGRAILWQHCGIYTLAISETCSGGDSYPSPC